MGTFEAEIQEDQAVASAVGLHPCSLQQLHTQDMYTGPTAVLTQSTSWTEAERKMWRVHT